MLSDVNCITHTAPLHVNANKTMIVCSVDIGMLNLALVVAEVDVSTQTLCQIEQVEQINLTELKHQRVEYKQCLLNHTRDTVDRVDHFLQEYQPLLSRVDFFLIERQPLHGLKDIEQLLYSRWRHISELRSPNAMHKHFRISHLDYDQRKVETVKLAQPYIDSDHEWHKWERKHDVADAVCQLLFWLKTRPRMIMTPVQKQDMNGFFEKFIYRPRNKGTPTPPQKQTQPIKTEPYAQKTFTAF